MKWYNNKDKGPSVTQWCNIMHCIYYFIQNPKCAPSQTMWDRRDKVSKNCVSSWNSYSPITHIQSKKKKKNPAWVNENVGFDKA